MAVLLIVSSGATFEAAPVLGRRPCHASEHQSKVTNVGNALQGALKPAKFVVDRFDKSEGAMPSSTPPQGMSELDYDAIEAAVTETVRGRWFLNEFARRNRTGELRQVLDAVARLESAVAIGQNSFQPPPSDPSVRLLMQRIKEISSRLDVLSGEMREAGAEAQFVDAVALQARAVSGMLRGGVGIKPAPETRQMPTSASPEIPPFDPRPAAAPHPLRMPRADLPSALQPFSKSEPVAEPAGLPTPPAALPLEPAVDPRIALLSGLDRLPLAEKLALFR